MKLFYVLFSILILPLACSDSSSKNNHVASPEASIESAVSLDASEHEIKQNSNIQIEQKLIKEAYLEFETNNLDNTFNNISSFVKKYNGYIQDDNSRKSYNRISRRLTLRIPTTGFQPILDSISNHASYFDTKQISSKDVTEEFIDIEARLKAKKELEKRYLGLLSKAKNVKEILEVERELSHIREEIEAKQGRLNYLQNRVSLSTITVEFYKTTAQESGVTVSYGQKMWNAIKSGVNGISLFFLGLLHIWPFILIVTILFFLVKRWIKKRNAR